VALTAQEIDTPTADVLADVDANYRSELAPFTRYRSDGERLLAQSDEGHQHVEDDIAGLPTLLGQLATDNAAALTASSQALIAATNAAADATAAQAAASEATSTATSAELSALDAAAAAGAAQRTADSALLAAASAQTQVDTFAGDVSAATKVAADASDTAIKAEADVAEVAGVPFLVLGAVGVADQARQLVAGSRIALSDSGPGGLLTVEARTDVASQFTAGQAVAFIDLVIDQDGRVAWDARLSNNARLMLTSDAVLEYPEGLMSGQELKLRVELDLRGGHALAFDGRFSWPGGMAPVVDPAPGAVSLVTLLYDDAENALLGRADLGYSLPPASNRGAP